jgi:hypothetical protein
MFPDSTVSELKIGDFLLVNEKIVVEIKIDQDAHDYRRAGHELTNMNLEKYAGLHKHLIYVSDSPYAFHEFKILVGLCMKANIYPHHVFLLKCPDYTDPRYEGKFTDLPRKIQQLTQPAYQKPLQIKAGFSKECDQIGKVVETFDGFGNHGGEISEAYKIEGTLLKAADKVIGVKLDGSSKKATIDMTDFLENLKIR